MGAKEIRINVILSIIYAVAYDYSYKNYMYNFFSYMYCPDPSPINDNFIVYLILSIFPILFFKGFSTIASGISFMVYSIIYIPMMYVALIAEIDPEHRVECVVALLVVTSLCFATDHVFLLKNDWERPIRGGYPFVYLEIIGLVIFLVVLVAEGRNLKFVDIWHNQDEMYDLRVSHSKDRSAVISYFISWSRNAFLPLFLVFYLKSKQYVKYAISLGGYMVLFMIDMQKITLLMPYVMTLVFWGMKKVDLIKHFSKCVLLPFSLLSFLIATFTTNIILFGIGSVVIMRTLCLDSWLFSMYLDFFKNNPYTYYTHVNIVNALTGAYPYHEVLGYAVSYGKMNANASFLITDGYASMGVVGIYIIGVIFVVLKSIFNCTGLRVDRKFIILILFPAISSMLNVSLFTAILSCGFLILYFVLKYFDFGLMDDVTSDD